MPLTQCSTDGKPGWKWGDAGHCYTYTPGDADSEADAKQKAIDQGLAEGGGELKSNVGDVLCRTLFGARRRR